MLLLVGLGNPGREHADNRHNVGFMAVDEVIRRHGLAQPRTRSRPNGMFSEGRIAGMQLVVLKPLTWMNLSGQAVGEAMRYWKLEPADVTVIHDDLDLAPGKVRIKRGGGHGGHNGLRSIDSHIGPDYRRVRIGIGHPGDRDAVTDWVLRDFAKADRVWLAKTLDAIAEATPLLVAGDDAGFMSRVALLTQPPRPKKPPPDDRAADGAEKTDEPDKS